MKAIEQFATHQHKHKLMLDDESYIPISVRFTSSASGYFRQNLLQLYKHKNLFSIYQNYGFNVINKDVQIVRDICRYMTELANIYNEKYSIYRLKYFNLDIDSAVVNKYITQYDLYNHAVELYKRLIYHINLPHDVFLKSDEYKYFTFQYNWFKDFICDNLKQILIKVINSSSSGQEDYKIDSVEYFKLIYALDQTELENEIKKPSNQSEDLKTLLDYISKPSESTIKITLYPNVEVNKMLHIISQKSIDIIMNELGNPDLNRSLSGILSIFNMNRFEKIL